MFSKYSNRGTRHNQASRMYLDNWIHHLADTLPSMSGWNRQATISNAGLRSIGALPLGMSRKKLFRNSDDNWRWQWYFRSESAVRGVPGDGESPMRAFSTRSSVKCLCPGDKIEQDNKRKRHKKNPDNSGSYIERKKKWENYKSSFDFLQYRFCNRKNYISY